MSMILNPPPLRLEDVEESRRMSQEKQEKAEQHRYRLQEERTQKYKMASDKVQYPVYVFVISGPTHFRS